MLERHTLPFYMYGMMSQRLGSTGQVSLTAIFDLCADADKLNATAVHRFVEAFVL